MNRISLGPKCSAIITSNGQIYVSGANVAKRLSMLHSKEVFHQFTKVANDILDIKFGEKNALILKTNHTMFNVCEGVATKLSLSSMHWNSIIVTNFKNCPNYCVAVTKNAASSIPIIKKWPVEDPNDIEDVNYDFNDAEEDINFVDVAASKKCLIICYDLLK